MMFGEPPLAPGYHASTGRWRAGPLSSAGSTIMSLQIWELTQAQFYPGSSGYASCFIAWAVDEHRRDPGVDLLDRDVVDTVDPAPPGAGGGGRPRRRPPGGAPVPSQRRRLRAVLDVRFAGRRYCSGCSST